MIKMWKKSDKPSDVYMKNYNHNYNKSFDCIQVFTICRKSLICPEMNLRISLDGAPLESVNQVCDHE